jgi:hypothetical protein
MPDTVLPPERDERPLREKLGVWLPWLLASLLSKNIVLRKKFAGFSGALPAASLLDELKDRRQLAEKAVADKGEVPPVGGRYLGSHETDPDARSEWNFGADARAKKSLPPTAPAPKSGSGAAVAPAEAIGAAGVEGESMNGPAPSPSPPDLLGEVGSPPN